MCLTGCLCDKVWHDKVWRDMVLRDTVWHDGVQIVRNLSEISAVEESYGQDSSVVRRPIEIVSN